MADFPTYAYKDDQVLAFDGNTVIAHGADFAKVAETAEEYFNELRNAHTKKAADESRSKATHVVTPSGLKGTILSSTKGLWNDEITVRFENGEIRHFATFSGDGLVFEAHAAEAPKTPMDYFQAKLDEAIVPTRAGLTSRLNVLDEIRNEVSHLVTAGTSATDTHKLHQIVMAAEAEKREVSEVLAHLVAADEAIDPFKPAYSAVEQADLGRAKGDSWLDVVAAEIVTESEAQDFDQLLAEGPTEFVSGLDNSVVAHAGTTQQLASDFIHSKTAGFQGEAVEEYRSRFIAAVEMARRQDLVYRQDAIKKDKTAKKERKTAKKLLKDTPDEALFL